MDLFFQGLSWFNKGVAPNNVMQALAYFERAWAIDPNNVDALAWMAVAMAVAYAVEISQLRTLPRLSRQPKPRRPRRCRCAPEYASAHFAASVVFGFSTRIPGETSILWK